MERRIGTVVGVELSSAVADSGVEFGTSILGNHSAFKVGSEGEEAYVEDRDNT